MAEVIQTMDLGNGLTLRVFDDDRRQVVDDSNRFVEHEMNYLPPESARSMRKGKNKRNSPLVKEAVADLLEALPDEVMQDPRKAWLAEKLANEIVLGGTGTASIAKALMGIIGLRQAEYNPPEIGQTCPRCGAIRSEREVKLSAELGLMILEILEVRQKPDTLEQPDTEIAK